MNMALIPTNLFQHLLNCQNFLERTTLLTLTDVNNDIYNKDLRSHFAHGRSFSSNKNCVGYAF